MRAPRSVAGMLPKGQRSLPQMHDRTTRRMASVGSFHPEAVPLASRRVTFSPLKALWWGQWG